MEGTRDRSAGKRSDPRAPIQIQTVRAGTWRQPRAIFSIGRMYEKNSLTTCQCVGLTAEIQSRIRRYRVSAYRDPVVQPRADKEYQSVVSCETKTVGEELHVRLRRFSFISFGHRSQSEKIRFANRRRPFFPCAAESTAFGVSVGDRFFCGDFQGLGRRWLKKSDIATGKLLIKPFWKTLLIFLVQYDKL